MKNDLSLAIKHLSSERGLPREIVLEAIEAALVSAYKKTPQGNAQNVTVKLDPQTGKPHVLAEKEVVEDVKDERSQIALKQAQRISATSQLGETIQVDVTPADFGRIAAQTAKQVILQRIREAERDQLYALYKDQEGEIVQGVVQSLEPTQITISLDKAEAILPRKEQIPRERYHANQRLRVYIVEVKKTNKGPEIVVSRTHRNMLRRLFELEVPEIFNGTVEIKAIAREAGSRSKVAVATQQDGVDPVGACVGLRGVRIQALVNELGGEKIDVIEWNPDPSLFIAKALGPAMVLNVKLAEAPEGKTASVIVPDKQLSLAIGKEGQNARLAAKLTGWRIDIKSESEAAQEAKRLAEEAAQLAEQEAMLEAARQLLREAAEAAARDAELAELAESQERVEGLLEAAPEEVEPEQPVAEAGPETPELPEQTALAEAEGPAGDAQAQVSIAEVIEPQQPATPEQPEAVSPVQAQETEAKEKEQGAPSAEPDAWARYRVSEAAEEDEEDDIPQSKAKAGVGKKKDKKKVKGQALVYDERLGTVVSEKQRKPGRHRTDWQEELERLKLTKTLEEGEASEAEDDWRKYLPKDEEDGEEGQDRGVIDPLRALADTDEDE